MKIKAIVSDFDGTIVSYDQQITQKVKVNIAEYIKKGGIFSIATGRAYEGLLQDMCHELKMTTPQIVRGGAEIVSAKTDEIIWGKYIHKNIVEDVLNILLGLDEFIILAESGKDLFTKDAVADPEFATGAMIKDISDIPMNLVPKVAIPPLYEIERIEPILNQLKNEFPQLHIVKTTGKKGFGIDINDSKAGKESALKAFSELMNIHPEEIIGIGDSFNDLPLLSACGVKVAMGNAPDELKDIANYVVGTQAQDGVVEVIELAKKLS